MQVIVHKSLKKIKTKYEYLYNNSPYKNVFMSYDFLKNCLKAIEYNRLLRFLKNKSKIRFLEVINENGLTILILPVIIHKDKLRSIPTYDYYDILFGNFENQVLLEALYAIVQKYNLDITFFNVTDRSKLYEIIKNLHIQATVSPHGCGAIELPKTYEDYYLGLTKSSRQNLRTAYNRLEKDNLQIKMNYYLGNVPKKVYKQSKQMYIKRFFEKNPNKRSLIKYAKLQLFEPFSKICYKTKNSFHAILTIDNKPAAAMAGLVNDKRVIIPRLVFNSDFKKYSPGILLINETIKYMIGKNIFEILDLGYGEESYKFVMGAQPYVTYDIQFKRK